MSEYFTNPRDGWITQDVTAVNEIIESINARLPYGSEDTLDLVEDGDALQDVNLWRDMQYLIWDLARQFTSFAGRPRFVVLHDHPPYDQYNFVSGDSFIHGRMTATTGVDSDSPRDLWNLADLPMRFRRAREYDPDVNDWTNPADPMFIPYTTSGVVNTGIGQVAVGDILGPWLIEDMQKALDVMTTVGIGDAYNYGDYFFGHEIKYYNGSNTSEDSFAAAYAAASAAWSLTGVEFYGKAAVTKYELTEDTEDFLYNVQLERASMRLKPPDAVTPQGGTQVKAERDGARVVFTSAVAPFNTGGDDVFFAHGDDVADTAGQPFQVKFGSFVDQFDTLGTESAYPTSVRRFDESSIPEADPSPPETVGLRGRGYRLQNSNMLIQPEMPYKIDRTEPAP